ncbi:unnamed protein product [Leuciscus chuanchicus]
MIQNNVSMAKGQFFHHYGALLSPCSSCVCFLETQPLIELTYMGSRTHTQTPSRRHKCWQKERQRRPSLVSLMLDVWDGRSASRCDWLVPSHQCEQASSSCVCVPGELYAICRPLLLQC